MKTLYFYEFNANQNNNDNSSSDNNTCMIFKATNFNLEVVSNIHLIVIKVKLFVVDNLWVFEQIRDDILVNVNDRKSKFVMLFAREQTFARLDNNNAFQL